MEGGIQIQLALTAGSFLKKLCKPFSPPSRPPHDYRSRHGLHFRYASSGLGERNPCRRLRGYRRHHAFCEVFAMTVKHKFNRNFASQMNRLNDEFIELEIRLLRELIRFIDAHKPMHIMRNNTRLDAYDADVHNGDDAPCVRT